MGLPPPSDVGLLERLKLSLGSNEAFLWRERLLQERLMRNVTALQERILLYVRDLIDSGLDQFAHADVAAALQVGIGTVKDALKRAAGIGLIEWRAQYRPGPNGSQRRTVNVYQTRMPQGSPEPRPDLRRRTASKSRVQTRKNVQPTCSPQCDERGWPAPWQPPPGFEARFAAKLAQERARRPP